MLASEPPSSRVHAGGGISVRVNGSSFEESGNSNSISSERSGTIVSSGRNSETEAESRPTGWANATITWRSGAQPFICSSNDDVSSGIAPKASVVTTPQMVTAQPSSEDKSSSAQLVHVIRVQGTTPTIHEAPVVPDSEMSRFDSHSYVPNNASPACIRITSPRNFYGVTEGSCRNGDSSGDKISVDVRPSLGDIMKGEDERSSSGASSAPGSDCERSDSDREGDDGTDSGFSSSRRPCASIMVTAKNSINLNENHSPNWSAVQHDSPRCETVELRTPANDKGNVKLTIGSYADKEPNEAAPHRPSSSEPWDMEFHLRELDETQSDTQNNAEDVQTKIATAHALIAGQDGSYSLKNRVRSSIVSLLVQSTSNRNYEQEEVGRIVFYTTSMGIVRNTYERCRKVRKILETLMVKFEERDVFMNRGFQQEIRERLGSTKVTVPQVFVEGRHLGGAEVLEQLNEIGHLREFLRPYKRMSVGGTCQQCGGYRYLLCSVCGGSKKSVTHRHHFSDDLVALRCVTCDESGLIRCPQCINGEG